MSDEHNDLSISSRLLQACQYLEWVSTHRCLLLDLSRLSRKFDYYIQNLPSQHHQSEWKWYLALKKINTDTLKVYRSAYQMKIRYVKVYGTHFTVYLPVPVNWSDECSEIVRNNKTETILCCINFMLTFAGVFALQS